MSARQKKTTGVASESRKRWIRRFINFFLDVLFFGGDHPVESMTGRLRQVPLPVEHFVHSFTENVGDAKGSIQRG